MSVDPAVSFRDSKQLVLFAIVPLVYRLSPGRRTLTAVDVIITAGALSAAALVPELKRELRWMRYNTT